MKGFIALTSVVIISAILLMVTLSGSLTGFYSRYSILDVELKEQSTALADACADIVLLRLAENPLFAGPETVMVGEDRCTIFDSPNPGENPRTFIVQGIHNRSYTNIALIVNTDTLSLISWQEMPAYP